MIEERRIERMIRNEHYLRVVALAALPAVAMMLALLAAAPREHLAKLSADVVEAFPLREGSYWIYQGPTRWTAENSAQVETRTITWRMEVTSAFRRGSYEGALLKGHPADLAWYEEGKGPGEYLIVRKDGRKYYLLEGDRKDEALAWLRGSEGGSSLPLDPWDLFLQLPLAPGKSFGGEGTDRGGLYRWNVMARRSLRLPGVKGLDSAASHTGYTLSFVTAPDETELEFVPGVGITHFRYTHHGTVSETDLRLVEVGNSR